MYLGDGKKSTGYYYVMSVLVNDMLLSIGLTMLSIFIISLLLTVNLTVSLLSLGAVAATIVDTIAIIWQKETMIQ